MKWIRTCQECNHKQEDKEPVYSQTLNRAYENRKCKKCKSESLDYGSEKPDTPEEVEEYNRMLESEM